MAAPRKPKTPEGHYLLTIRDVPGDVMIGLEGLADAEERSVEAEALVLLREVVKQRMRQRLKRQEGA